MRFGLTSKNLFLGLAFSQAAHSIEEFYFRLYDVLAFTRYFVGLISRNLAVGFAVANTLVVAFIFWTYFRRVRPATGTATAWIWGWSLLETASVCCKNNMPDYCTFHDGRLAGGFRRADVAVAAENGSPLIVFYKEDLAAATVQVAELGGTISRDIFSFPGGRRFHFTDPNGNEFAIWSDK